MKKIVLWILGISLVCLGIGFAIISYEGGFRVKQKNIDISKTASIDDVETINITTSSADVIISPSNNNEILLRYFGEMKSNNKNEPEVKINKVGSDLDITSGMPESSLYTILTGFKLEIKIPTSYSKNITIKSDSGNLEADSLILEEITGSTTRGNIDLTNCKSKENVNTDSGNIKIVDSLLENNREIKTSSGDVNLFLPKDSSFGLTFNTDSGVISDLFGLSIRQNTGKNITAAAGDNKYNISVKTTSGNLNINKNN